MQNPRVNTSRLAMGLLAVALAGMVSCDPGALNSFLVNNTTALGNGAVLQGVADTVHRGAINIAIQNNTAYFVSVVLGAFDPLNEVLAPDYRQVISTSDAPDQTIGPFETSSVAVLVCGRTVSLGDSTLVQAIRARDNAPPPNLEAGITFSTKLTDDPDAESFTVNNIPNQIVNLGVDYQCESLVFYELNQDDTQPSGIRINVTIVLP